MLNFKKINELTSEILACDTAMNKMKNLALKLTAIKPMPNVEISISLLEPAKKDPNARHNVDHPIFMISTVEDLKDIYTQPKKVAESYERKTITESNMPPELALNMFSNMRNFYEMRKSALEIELYEILSSGAEAAVLAIQKD